MTKLEVAYQFALDWIKTFQVTKLDMTPGDRMVRLCIYGQNKGRGFARIDLWWIGFRVTKKSGDSV